MEYIATTSLRQAYLVRWDLELDFRAEFHPQTAGKRTPRTRLRSGVLVSLLKTCSRERFYGVVDNPVSSILSNNHAVPTKRYGSCSTSGNFESSITNEEYRVLYVFMAVLCHLVLQSKTDSEVQIARCHYSTMLPTEGSLLV